jgi:RNA polymerase sigma-70 factor (ECF subfamily)
VTTGGRDMSERTQQDKWLAASRAGDRLALTKLLATCYPRLRARAAARMERVLAARSSPDDILQEVYLQVFHRIGQFEPQGPESFLSWVYAILDHKLIDAHRAAHRRVRDVDREVSPVARDDSGSYWNLLDQLQVESATPSRVIRRDEALGALVDCVSELPEVHQQVIRLRFLEGLSVEEVAERLNKSRGAVVALSQRAFRTLREAMDRRGEFTRGD